MFIHHRLRLLLGFSYACCLGLVSPPARANENTIEYDTSVAGQLVPKEETELQVRGEDLEIRFEEINDYGFFQEQSHYKPVRVHVTARYKIFNPGAAREPLIAFPILRNGPEEQTPYLRLNYFYIKNQNLPKDLRRGVQTAVRVNDTTLTARYVSFDSLFEKERARWAAGVRQWLTQWPEIARDCDLGAATLNHDPNSNKLLVGFSVKHPKTFDWPFRNPFKRDTPEAGMMEVVRRQACTHARIETWDLDALSALYGGLHPKEDDTVTSFQDRWGIERTYLNPLTGEPMKIEPFKSVGSIHYDLSHLHHRVDFLEYRPSFPSGKEVTVEVSYSHLLDAAFYPPKSAYLNSEYFYEFQYILRTSPKWKDFGPINLRVMVPCLMASSLSPSLQWQGETAGQDVYTAQILGSQVKENLLVAMMPGALIPSYCDSQYQLLPGDQSYLPNLRADWERYKARPGSPFADDLLYRMAQWVMNEINTSGHSKTDDADIDWLRNQPEFARPQATGDNLRATLAISLLDKIPPGCQTRSHDAQFTRELYLLKLSGNGDLDLSRLEKILQSFQKSWPAAGKQGFSETRAMDDWLTLCRLYRGELPEANKAGQVAVRNIERIRRTSDIFSMGLNMLPPAKQTPEASARRKDFYVLLASIEKELRLDQIQRMDFSLYYTIVLNDNICLRYADAYALYRDVPEAANLLHFLTEIRQDKLNSHHEEFAQELGQHLDHANKKQYADAIREAVSTTT